MALVKVYQVSILYVNTDSYLSYRIQEHIRKGGLGKRVQPK